MISSTRADSVLIGAIADIYPETLQWSYRPDIPAQERTSPVQSVCHEPVLEDLGAERAEATTRSLAARLLMGTNVEALSNPHELRCASGGEWGPQSGTELLLTQSGTLLIGWERGEILRLEKLDRPPARRPAEAERDAATPAG
ncbi:MAG: hypothetical protein AAFY47_10000 [Pseudomonadota bacterium]